VVQCLGIRDLDYVICYQSRATPEEWTGPSTEEEIERAGRDGVAVLVVPIAFVSEHAETLVELDIDYKELAERVGVPGYFRAPAPNTDAGFIGALAGLVRRMRGFGPGICSHVGGRTCPGAQTECPFARADARNGCIRDDALDLMRNRGALLRLVIFDCDGVIVDSEPLANRVVVAELGALGWTMTSAETERLFLGMTFSDMVPVIERRLGRPVPAGLARSLEDAVDRGADAGSQPIAGALEALKGVSALGVPGG